MHYKTVELNFNFLKTAYFGLVPLFKLLTAFILHLDDILQLSTHL